MRHSAMATGARCATSAVGAALGAARLADAATGVKRTWSRKALSDAIVAAVEAGFRRTGQVHPGSRALSLPARPGSDRPGLPRPPARRARLRRRPLEDRRRRYREHAGLFAQAGRLRGRLCHGRRLRRASRRDAR